MTYGVLFMIMGGIFATISLLEGGPYWLLAWPGVAFTLVGIAYLGRSPRLLGKKDNGRIRGPILLILLPYFALVRITWSLLRAVRKTPPHDELLPGIVIGRRLLGHEVPGDISTIVDLTAEFREPYRVRSGRTYLALPVLDGSVPDDEALLRLLERIHESPRKVYIHCAEGHGRTGLVACAYIMSTGGARDPGEAILKVKERRPRATLSSAQRAQLERMKTTLVQARDERQRN